MGTGIPATESMDRGGETDSARNPFRASYRPASPEHWQREDGFAPCLRTVATKTCSSGVMPTPVSLTAT
jgi:hypothetical protein